MKVLFTANTELHLELCHLSYLKEFKKRGFEVDVATKKNHGIPNVDHYYDIPIKRSPFSLSNIKAFFLLKKIITQGNYDLIHTHTPTASVLTRLASLKLQKEKKVKVFYTAHGFHFFKGCSWFNRILYYPIEKFLSKYTDVIITMNEEDTKASKKFFCKSESIPGIGFKKELFSKKTPKKELQQLKKELDIAEEDFIITYIAEITKRKNQIALLKAIRTLDIPSYKVLLVGNVIDKNIYKIIKKYHLEKKVCVLGFRKDVNALLDITDVCVSVSKQEGLPLHILEAMYKEKNIVVSNIRGHVDLIHNHKNGILFSLKHLEKLNDALIYYYHYPNQQEFRRYNRQVIEQYSSENVIKKMNEIYRKYGVIKDEKK